MKRYSRDIFLCLGISRLGLGCHGPMDWTLSLFSVQTSPVQANADHYTICSRNLRKFSLNDVHELTVQLDGHLLGSLPGSPLLLPVWGWLSQGKDITIAAAIATVLCERSCRGGLMLQRNLSAVALQLNWLNSTGSLATKRPVVL